MTSSPFRNTVAGQGLALLVFVALSFAAATMGAFFSPGEWYQELNKPSWNPPPWIFGPVWNVLYLLMAFSAWLVWREGGLQKQRLPLSFYGLQLCLNAVWTPVFFGGQWPAGGFVVIILLWLAIVVTILRFWPVHRWAAWLMVPYLIWVSFASVLNAALWRLNS